MLKILKSFQTIHLAGVVEDVGRFDVVMNDPPAAHLIQSSWQPAGNKRRTSPNLTAVHRGPYVEVPQATQDLNNNGLCLLQEAWASWMVVSYRCADRIVGNEQYWGTEVFGSS